MANIRKQFNFRNGVQVDNDNLVVSPTGLVGIGTTVPTQNLDVRGNISATGFSTSPSLFAQTAEIRDSITTPNVTFTDFIVGSGVTIGSGIVTATGSGIVTYYGDARFLQGMPTSQWKDMDVGLGFTSIYNEGNVGVGTTDPRFRFQIGGTNDTTVVGFTSGVGFSTTGDILATGIATATAFVGIGSLLTELNASSISYGTLTNDRIPVLENSKIPNDFTVTGVITATRFDGNVQAGLVTATNGFTGNLTGTASTALSLSGTPDVIVGVLTASAVAASSFIGGITGDVTGNLTGDVTGNLTGTATTATALTPTANVDIADLTVGIASVSEFIGVGTDFKTGSIAIGNSTTSSGNDIFINRAGTEVQNANVKLWSNLGESTVTIGTSEAVNGTNGQIRYGNRSLSFPYSTSDSLDFLNYGDGSINYYLQAGVAGIGTGSFHWHNKDGRMMSLTYDGNLGIGLTDPTDRLHVAGLSRFVGEATFTSNVTIDGTLSVNASSPITASLTGDVTGNLTGNVRAQSGISTFNDVHMTSNVAIGVTVDHSGNTPFRIGPNVLDRFMVDSDGNVGIRTDTITNEIELHVNGDIKAQHGLVVGPTLTPKAGIDFSSLVDVTDAGTSRATIAYMIPPRLTTTQRNALTGTGGGSLGNNEAGATIYNTSTNKLQVWNGSTWNDCF